MIKAQRFCELGSSLTCPGAPDMPFCGSRLTDSPFCPVLWAKALATGATRDKTSASVAAVILLLIVAIVPALTFVASSGRNRLTALIYDFRKRRRFRFSHGLRAGSGENGYNLALRLAARHPRFVLGNVNINL